MLFVEDVDESLAQRAQCILVLPQLDVTDLVAQRRGQRGVDMAGNDGVSHRQYRQSGLVAIDAVWVLRIGASHDEPSAGWLQLVRVIQTVQLSHQ